MHLPGSSDHALPADCFTLKKGAYMRRSILVFSSVLLLLMLAVGVSVSASPEAQSGQTTYTVVYGDTLFRISLRFNTTIQALASANNISNVNLIYAGQTLTIPGPGGGTGT